MTNCNINYYVVHCELPDHKLILGEGQAMKWFTIQEIMDLDSICRPNFVKTLIKHLVFALPVSATKTTQNTSLEQLSLKSNVPSFVSRDSIYTIIFTFENSEIQNILCGVVHLTIFVHKLRKRVE